jgi:hypothetical protein|uniref:Uncharacterized protein n=1 Tax=viral metagenome TaxID=1070528 RepID=A0A6C0B0W7_9ZZZZ
MVWSLEDNPLDHKELEIYKYVKKQSGNSGLAHIVSRFVSLREYLDSNRFASPAELQKNVLSHGVPVFSKNESEHLFKLAAKTGGGADVELVDNVIGQWVKYMYEWQPSFIQEGVDMISPYVFIAKTLESGTFGPLFSIALDSITATLPIIATSAENLTPEIIGFLPIPEAGPVGAIIGWMIASVFVSLSMMIHLSRAHFGQAFVISFLLIPFLGTTLYNGALSVEKFGTKVSAKREKLINTVSDLFGEVPATVLEGLMPDPLKTPEDMSEQRVNLLETGKKSLTNLASSVGLADKIEGPRTGGKQLSRRNRYKCKWRTQKKLR